MICPAISLVGKSFYNFIRRDLHTDQMLNLQWLCPRLCTYSPRHDATICDAPCTYCHVPILFISCSLDLLVKALMSRHHDAVAGGHESQRPGRPPATTASVSTVGPDRGGGVDDVDKRQCGSPQVASVRAMHLMNVFFPFLSDGLLLQTECYIISSRLSLFFSCPCTKHVYY